MKLLCRTWAEIDIDAIVNNCCLIKNISGKAVYAVVKADAYGHGAVPVAKALEKRGLVAGFAVSNIVEAEELRSAGISLPILILGYTPIETAQTLAQLEISQSIFSLDYAKALNNEAKKLGINIKSHLKLDTGMGRIGFDCRSEGLRGIREAEEALELEALDFEGVFTHFAVADGVGDDDKEYTAQQYERFVKAVDTLEGGGASFKIKHCGNSAASLTLNMEKMTAVRAGIILYGLTPDTEFKLPEGFKPAMSLYSAVSEVKNIETEETVSYGRTYKAEKPRKIATVTAGYADGVPRLLSNRGEVIINGKRAPIAGRVCMDQFCVDVTDIANVSLGDRVTVFGEGLAVEEVAKHARTINYEIICGISKRVPRIHYEKHTR